MDTSTTLWVVSYPQQPGYQPQYGPPPGYGYPPPPQYGRPSTAIAYVAALVAVVGCALMVTWAGISWDGTSTNYDARAAVFGMAFSADLTGNVDFAITASMITAGVTLLFALLLLARLEFVRWVLAVLGGLITAYYVYAVIYLLSHEASKFVGLALLMLVLWLAVTVLVIIPPAGRAMRSYRPPVYQPPAPYGYH